VLTKKYPICISGRNAGPYEDCESIEEFIELRESSDPISILLKYNEVLLCWRLKVVVILIFFYMHETSFNLKEIFVKNIILSFLTFKRHGNRRI
jgi:hypothetical protein